jgi:dimethylargininase
VIIALTRPVSPRLGACELTYLSRVDIDPDRATAQHAAYCEVLTAVGCEVVSLPAEPRLPDGVFVEDTAVVVDELAVITRPGVLSRRPETASTAAALRVWRHVEAITDPGTLEGGDVLRMGRTLYVGVSARSNPTGIAQLEALLAPWGYDVVPADLRGCLHLKSAVSQVGPDLVLINPTWVAPQLFAAYQQIEVDPQEPGAANALRVGGQVIYAASFPRTAARLRSAGLSVIQVDVSELQKAEAGVTCCSILLAS